ncbi:metalloproteinase inhibitor 2-like [Thalassophryne amazonica]|uniref:metalloproteinase inhibitor 2-like n=1 Tax=Thalassophryne amazonica TaxID=390379 RepID=UPI001470B5CE|nr:metalloproteinase inhibitor 2-like [Thalassophryne amazonica]
MSWTVKTCFVTLIILFLWRDGEVAEACTCVLKHPQQHFCDADVVIRATVGKHEEVHDENGPFGINLKKYKITQIQLYKAPNLAQEFKAFYTADSSAVCGASPAEGDYVIAGNLNSNGSLHVSLCSFMVLWDSITVVQKQGLCGQYAKNCNCTITRCHSTPCGISHNMECLWTDDLIQNHNGGKWSQEKYSICIKRPDNSCSWQSRRKPHSSKNKES